VGARQRTHDRQPEASAAGLGHIGGAAGPRRQAGADDRPGVAPGNMGSGLGGLWARAGHEVMFSYSRSPEKLRELAAAAGRRGRSGSPGEAAAFADLVLLSVPWSQLDAALAEMGPAASALTGKVLLSTVNPVTEDLNHLEVGHTTSAAEVVAAGLPARGSSRASSRCSPPCCGVSGGISTEDSDPPSSSSATTPRPSAWWPG
jgi:hypothetical protein